MPKVAGFKKHIKNIIFDTVLQKMRKKTSFLIRFYKKCRKTINFDTFLLFLENLPFENPLKSCLNLEVINKGINKGSNKGINKGFSKGINKGISKRINKGINEGINKGSNKGINHLFI